MADMMTFPNTVEEFMEQYKIVDTEKIYTNGADLVPIFRMMQWLEHVSAMDTISRRAAIDALCRVDEYNGRSIEAIRQLPPAQPKKGRWISADAMFHGVPFYCSECGENTRDTVMGKPRWKFCPMCGAKMEGADDE